MVQHYPRGVIHNPDLEGVEINLELETDIQEDIADFDRWMREETLGEESTDYRWTTVEPFFRYECADRDNCNSFRRNNFACRCVRRNFTTATHFAQYNRSIQQRVMHGIEGETNGVCKEAKP